MASKQYLRGVLIGINNFIKGGMVYEGKASQKEKKATEYITIF